jgi:hypothetical protein
VRARSKGQWKALGVGILVVGAAVGLTWLYYQRKSSMRGRAMDARIEGAVLVLVDEVCTQSSDRNAAPECDKRLTKISLPDGKKLDVSFEGGVNPYRRQLAQIVGDAVVVATEEPSLRAAAFELATGARRWTVQP